MNLQQIEGILNAPSKLMLVHDDEKMMPKVLVNNDKNVEVSYTDSKGNEFKFMRKTGNFSDARVTKNVSQWYNGKCIQSWSWCSIDEYPCCLYIRPVDEGKKE